MHYIMGGNSLSDLIVFGKRAGEYGAQFPKQNGAVKVDDAAVGPLDTDDRIADMKHQGEHRLLQHHQVLHARVPGAHPHHRQRDDSAERARGRSLLRPGDATASHGHGLVTA